MNTKNLLRISRVGLGLLTLIITLHYPISTLAEETAFTYQGRLNDSTGPINGFYDLTFAIYDLPTGNGLFAIETNLATRVSNGLFTVTLDFGPAVSEAIFSGPQRWLEINVRTNGSSSYAILTPRQRLAATPYAITAGNVTSSGFGGIFTNPVTFNNPANSYCGDGGCLTNVNATTLGGLTSADFWRLNGNIVGPTNFLGTLNNFPLEVKVNNNHALRIVPASVPSLEGGYFQNSTHGSSGAVIVGGGASNSINQLFGDYGFIGAGSGNQTVSYGAIVGGAKNLAGGQFSFVGSGLANNNSSDYSFIGAGTNNYIAPFVRHSVIGGGYGNIVSNSSAVVNGGVNNVVSGQYSLVGAGALNTNLADYAAIGGGRNNRIGLGAINSFVGAGFNNSATDTSTVIAGGGNNIADANAAAITGGSENHAGADHAYVGGGQANNSAQPYATVSGGYFGNANGIGATIGGGGYDGVNVLGNSANGNASFVGGGVGNTANGGHDVISGGFGNTASGARSVVAGGNGNIASADYSSVGGGGFNQIFASAAGVVSGGSSNSLSNASGATVAGGIGNSIVGSLCATIGGGTNNTVNNGAIYSTISGGAQNTVSNFYSTLGGGYHNTATGDSSTVAGGNFNFALGDFTTVAGGEANQAIGADAVIGGGTDNVARGIGAVIAGGELNAANDHFATVSGGEQNTASGQVSTISGGFGNTASGINSAVGGGQNNAATSNASVISGGSDNQSGGDHSAIGGGQGNRATNSYATIAGGANNLAGGLYSFAAGRDAYAVHQGSFVWADSQPTTFSSTNNDSFNVRAQGGVRFSSGAGGAAQNVIWTPGSASWSFSSDRNLKEGFEKVDGASVLDKVARLPISEWNYRGYSQRHIGPMAQDFHAAFPLNESNTTLNDADLHGVALAAIQGLNEKVESENTLLREQLNREQAANAELKERLERLEELMLNKVSH
jgi:hypothetical protein